VLSGSEWIERALFYSLKLGGRNRYLPGLAAGQPTGRNRMCGSGQLQSPW
jgi:hypothetical protein